MSQVLKKYEKYIGKMIFFYDHRKYQTARYILVGDNKKNFPDYLLRNIPTSGPLVKLGFIDSIKKGRNGRYNYVINLLGTEIIKDYLDSCYGLRPVMATSASEFYNTLEINEKVTKFELKQGAPVSENQITEGTIAVNYGWGGEGEVADLSNPLHKRLYQYVIDTYKEIAEHHRKEQEAEKRQ